MKYLYLILYFLCYSSHINAQSVKDTILCGIGVELFFKDDLRPKNITVISTRHHNMDKMLCAEYKYINHNRDDVCYNRFSTQFLEESYNKATIYPANFSSNKIINISPKLSDYLGYWIYLTKYKDEYYLCDDNMQGWTSSFKITKNRFDYLDMEGVITAPIIEFIKDNNGDFIIKFESMTSKGQEYTLVNKALGIYRDENNRLVTKAINRSRFDIIQYCSNYNYMAIEPW